MGKKHRSEKYRKQRKKELKNRKAKKLQQEAMPVTDKDLGIVDKAIEEVHDCSNCRHSRDIAPYKVVLECKLDKERHEPSYTCDRWDSLVGLVPEDDKGMSLAQQAFADMEEGD